MVESRSVNDDSHARRAFMGGRRFVKTDTDIARCHIVVSNVETP